MDNQENIRLAKYTIIEKVGGGGMADVYKAVENDTNRVVAIKFMRSIIRSDELNTLRFEREAEMLKQLEHPHIVEIYEFSQAEDKTHYLVLEYINGPTLRKTLKDLSEQRAMMSFEEVRELLNQVGSALRFAHTQGIVHRDVKPENIMMREDDSAALTDFGLAKLLRSDRSTQLTAAGAILGTPAYMSPEQAMGGNSDDVRVDIYSLGVMLFQMTTGMLPFKGESTMALLFKIINDPPPDPKQLNAKLPADLEQIILKSMSKEPADRYQSIEEMLADIGVFEFDDAFVTRQMALDELDKITLIEDQILDRELLSSPFQAPARPANFVGRYDEMGKVKQLLLEDQKPLVGIVGFGGVGKSSMAAQIVHDLRGQFADGILWAQLDTTSVKDELRNFAAAFGQTDSISRLDDIPSKVRFVRDLLADKEVLVVLDHVASGDQIRDLRPVGARNFTLVTARNGHMLHNLGAAVVPVKAFTEREGLVYFECMLGEQRVQQNRELALEIIDLVGGLPLALSIVAGSLISSVDFSLEDYVDLLKDEQERLGVLKADDDPTRDVEASFELSYKLLTERQKKIFRILGVFGGPDFDSKAVAALAGEKEPITRQILNTLYFMSLLSAGLGKRDGYFPIDGDGNGRYRLNLLLKTYARQKLGDALAHLQADMATYYLELAIQNVIDRDSSVLELEWHNIYHAIQWTYQNQQRELILPIVHSLTQFSLGEMGFLDRRGYWSEARELLEMALEVALQINNAVAELKIRLNLAGFAFRQSDFVHMDEQLGQAERLLSELSNNKQVTISRFQYQDLKAKSLWQSDRKKASGSLIQAVNTLSRVKLDDGQMQRGYLYSELSGTLGRSGEFDRALKAAQDSLRLLPEEPTTPKLVSLVNLGVITRETGRVSESSAWLEQAATAARELKDLNRLATTWLNLGTNSKHMGKLPEALDYFGKALPIFKRIGNIHYQLGTMMNMGQVRFILGDAKEAGELYADAITAAFDHEIKDIEAMLYSNLADLLLLTGEIGDAEAALMQAWDLCEEIGLKHLRSTVMRQQVQAMQERGKHEQVLEGISWVLQAAEETKDLMEQGIALRVKGVSLAAVGQTAEAHQVLRKSADMLTKQETFDYGRTLMAIADLYLQEGNTTEARSLLEDVMEVFGSLPARRELKLVQDKLDQL